MEIGYVIRRPVSTLCWQKYKSTMTVCNVKLRRGLRESFLVGLHSKWGVVSVSTSRKIHSARGLPSNPSSQNYLRLSYLKMQLWHLSGGDPDGVLISQQLYPPPTL